MSLRQHISKHTPAGSRRWVYAALVALLQTAFLLLIAEATAGYLIGYRSTAAFVTEEHNQKNYYRLNRHFYQQFFKLNLDDFVQWEILEQVLPHEKKDPATIRMIILGESAALGAPPDSVWSFSHILSRLCAADPAHPRQLEVLNLACPGASSTVMRQLTEQIVPLLHPDWIIVYMGNNEWIGPYGAATAYGVSAPTYWERFLRIWERTALSALLTGQPAYKPFSYPRCPDDLYRLYRLVKPEDQAWMATVERFRRNLKAICDTAEQHGVRAALCTVGVNLRDWGPYASEKDLLPTKQKELSGQTLTDHDATQDSDPRHRFESFLNQHQQDPNVWFQLGDALYETGAYDLARVAYQKARDLDWLPSGANSTINRIIRDTAAQYRGKGVILVDAEKILNEMCPHNIADSTAFYDGVHLSLAGHVRLAYQLKNVLFQDNTEAPDSPQKLEEQVLRLGLTPAEAEEHLKNLLRNLPPFHMAFTRYVPPGYGRNRTALVQKFRQWREWSQRAPHRENDRAADGMIASDRYLDARQLEHYIQNGSTEQATAAFELFRTRYPYLTQTCLLGYEISLLQSDKEQAEHWLRQTITWRGVNESTATSLRARLYAAFGDYPSAEKELIALTDKASNYASFWLQFAQTAQQYRQTDRALACFERAVNLDPRNQEANQVVDDLLETRFPENAAKQRLTLWKTIRNRYPASGEAAWRLGLALLETGDLEHASIQFKRAAALNPEWFDNTGPSTARLCALLKADHPDVSEIRTIWTDLPEAERIETSRRITRWLVSLEHPDRAVNLLTPLIRIDAANYVLCDALRKVLEKEAFDGQHVEDIWRKLAQDTDHYRVKYHLVWVLMSNSKTEEALEIAREVFHAAPDDPAMIMVLAEAAALAGKCDEVRENCPKMLTLSPGFPRAQELMDHCGNTPQ